MSARFNGATLRVERRNSDRLQKCIFNCSVSAPDVALGNTFRVDFDLVVNAVRNCATPPCKPNAFHFVCFNLLSPTPRYTKFARLFFAPSNSMQRAKWRDRGGKGTACVLYSVAVGGRGHRKFPSIFATFSVSVHPILFFSPLLYGRA